EYRYDARATDPDGDPLVWDLESGPTGMSVDPLSGAVRWSPTVAQLGDAAVRLRVSDGQGGTAEQSFTVSVRGANRPPQVISTPPTTAAAGTPYAYPVRATDPDGDRLMFSVFGPPSMTIDPSNGLLRWAPSAGDVAIYEITVAVSDGQATAFQT